MRLIPLIALCLLGCNKDNTGSTGEGTTTTPVTLEPEAAFRADLTSTGHTIRDGLLFYSTFENCCDPDANCLGNNPDTPYGTYALPKIPGEEPVRDYFDVWGQLPDPALTRSYRLRPDEALVYIGSAPPNARYLGAQSYLVQRPGAQGAMTGLVGSVGPTLNNVTIADDLDTQANDIWDRPMIVVTTADLAVEAKIHQALIRSGYDEADIHDDRIVGDIVRMGVGADADSFGHIWRVAVPEDDAAGLAYRENPGGVLLRVTPDEERDVFSPHPRPVLLERGSGTDEEAWRAAKDRLVQAIIDEHSDMSVRPMTSFPGHTPAYNCIEEGRLCNADSPDRFTWLTAYVKLDNPADFLVIAGVNHERTGKAAYSSFALLDLEHQVGFASVNSRDMVGSAQSFLPDEPLADDLYAYVVSRDCSGHTARCVQIPDTCPGPPVGDFLRVTMRAYLEIGTGAAPDDTELVTDSVMVFRTQIPD